MTTIIVTQENNELDEYDFDVEIKSITIGRRSTNDVCIPHLSVSGNHAKITISNSGSMVEDLNSTNGTYINGRLISRQLLNDGDDIVIGKTRVTFLQPEGSSYDADDHFKSDAEFGSSAAADSADEYDAPLTLAEKAALHRQQKSAEGGRSVKRSSKVSNRDALRIDDGSGLNDSVVDFDASTDDSFDDVATRSRKTVQSKLAPEVSPASAPIPSSSMRSELTPSRGMTSAAESRAVTGRFEAEADESLAHHLESESQINSGAVIEIKNGAKSGQVLPIDKPVTTLGRPGIQIAAIMKKPEGYFLMHIESENNVDRPRLNNDTIGDEPVLLASGDSLNVAGIDVQFMLS